jgi:hypothetical protein
LNKDRVDEFKEKYPERYEKLVHVNYISEATDVKPQVISDKDTQDSP